jgi:uncharacterized UBP type Zn finger protein
MNCYVCDECAPDRCDDCNQRVCEQHMIKHGNLLFCAECFPWNAQVMGWTAPAHTVNDEKAKEPMAA